MREFAKYHPVIIFLYYVSVIVLSMVFMHPVCLCISLLNGVICAVLANGGRVKGLIGMLIPLVLVSSVINPAFNHKGVTILTYLPSQNPLTLESIVYGFSASIMLAAAVCLFSSFNRVVTSDKTVYLFGRIVPALSLVFSMTLRFVPRFKRQMKSVIAAQKCMGTDTENGSLIVKLKNGIRILSSVLTWSLENAIEVSDSMKSRGFGVGKRTAYSNYIFDKRDKLALMYLLVTVAYTLVGAMLGKMSYQYFPSMKGSEASVYGVSVFVSYAMLCFMPIAIEIWEGIKWKKLKSKI